MLWIERFSAEHCLPLRTDPFNPGEAFAKAVFGPDVCWDRDEVVARAAKYLQNAVGAQPGVVERIGLCATLAARGCGKSFIVDRLCRLHGARYSSGSLILGNDLEARLVPVCISFNGPQGLESDRAASAKCKLFNRLVHRAFFTASTSFETFLNFLGATTLERLTAPVLFEAIVLYFQRLSVPAPIILLAVDEIIKCGAAQAHEILDVCKSYLNSHPHAFRLLVTTFDDHLLLDGAGFQSPDAVRQASVQCRDATGSQRPVTWLALNPLQLANPRGVLRTLRLPTEFSDEQLDYLVALSGGHPRSLALLTS